MTIAAPTPRQLIVDAITQVAPDIEPSDVEELDPGESLKDALELDSMDQLNIAAAIFERSGVNIPEQDYAHMDTRGAFEVYLAERLTEQRTESADS